LIARASSAIHHGCNTAKKKSRSRFGHIASATLRRYSCADGEGARTIKIEIIVHMLEENLIGRSRP